MNRYIYAEPRENRKKTGLILSLLFHILLLLLFLIPCFKHLKTNPPDLQGVIIALGESDIESNASVTKQEEIINESAKESREVKPEKKPSSTVLESQTRIEESELLASEEEIRRRELQEAELRRIEEEEKKRLYEEAERQRILEEKRAKEALKASAKSRFSKILNNSNSSGPSAGTPDGKPDAGSLSELTMGTGRKGTGLGSRELIYAPEIKDNTQSTGRVIIKICVDASGSVINAKYTQKGSTTTDARLISLAEGAVRDYKFSESDIEEQCGQIIIDFSLK